MPTTNNKKRGRKILAVCTAGTLLVMGCRPAKGDLFGIPGLPQIVWDPTTAADVVRDLVALQTYIQLYQTAQVYIHNKGAWKGMAFLPVATTVAGRIGETTGWGGAAQAGSGGPAWVNATIPLANSIPAIYGSARTRSAVATIEILDGTGIAAISAAGQAKNNSGPMGTVIKNLENNFLTDQAGANTVPAQLNMIGAGTLQNLHQQEATQGMQEAQLQLEAALAKEKRDELAADINFEAGAQTGLQNGDGYIGPQAAKIQAWTLK